MEKSRIQAILTQLRKTILYKKEKGWAVNRVRIGYKLCSMITDYLSGYVVCGSRENITIFGVPVEIDFNNPMLLEVASVEKILIGQEPIYFDGEEFKKAVEKALEKRG